MTLNTVFWPVVSFTCHHNNLNAVCKTKYCLTNMLSTIFSHRFQRLLNEQQNSRRKQFQTSQNYCNHCKSWNKQTFWLKGQFKCSKVSMFYTWLHVNSSKPQSRMQWTLQYNTTHRNCLFLFILQLDSTPPLQHVIFI